MADRQKRQVRRLDRSKARVFLVTVRMSAICSAVDKWWLGVGFGRVFIQLNSELHSDTAIDAPRLIPPAPAKRSMPIIQPKSLVSF